MKLMELSHFEKLPYGVYYLAETDADGKPVGEDLIMRSRLKRNSSQ